MPVISLTTDFGADDYEAGVLKGVIWKIAPDVHIVDLSHETSPQDIFEAALLLWRTVPFFPEGSVHMAVVDPGVGTERRAIAARLGSQYFVGPDNGLVTLLLSQAEMTNTHTQFVRLDRPEYWLSEVSHVFHGRDIFAPVAAHIASGVAIEELGTTINDAIRLKLPAPIPIIRGWRGRVIHIDHFGNLATNIQDRHIQSAKEVVINIKGNQIKELVSTFGERPPGTLIALLDSSGSLAISIVNGNAALTLPVVVGDEFEIQLM